MSERTEVEVLLPLSKIPTQAEQRELLKVAFREAKELVKPGRVLGIITITSAEHRLLGTAAPALKVRFAVEAPEAIQPQRSTY